jgi:hypothetical protein
MLNPDFSLSRHSHSRTALSLQCVDRLSSSRKLNRIKFLSTLPDSENDNNLLDRLHWISLCHNLNANMLQLLNRRRVHIPSITRHSDKWRNMKCCCTIQLKYIFVYSLQFRVRFKSTRYKWHAFTKAITAQHFNKHRNMKYCQTTFWECIGYNLLPFRVRFKYNRCQWLASGQTTLAQYVNRWTPVRNEPTVNRDFPMMIETFVHNRSLQVAMLTNSDHRPNFSRMPTVHAGHNLAKHRIDWLQLNQIAFQMEDHSARLMIRHSQSTESESESLKSSRKSCDSDQRSFVSATVSWTSSSLMWLWSGPDPSPNVL